jgi:hypothetical protein
MNLIEWVTAWRKERAARSAADAERRRLSAEEEQRREMAMDEVNPRCVCDHRRNVHGGLEGCRALELSYDWGKLSSVECRCMTFIARAPCWTRNARGGM